MEIHSRAVLLQLTSSLKSLQSKNLSHSQLSGIQRLSSSQVNGQDPENDILKIQIYRQIAVGIQSFIAAARRIHASAFVCTVQYT